MAVLVGYATAHDSTRDIARRLAERLRARGIAAVAQSLDAVSNPAAYDAFVLGSAIHNQEWLEPAAKFVRTHHRLLKQHPTWLFSVGSVGETSGAFPGWLNRSIARFRGESKQLRRYREGTGARGHRYFAGVVRSDVPNVAGKTLVTVFRGRYGDHRDWADIAAWADSIARELSASKSARR